MSDRTQKEQINLKKLLPMGDTALKQASEILRTGTAILDCQDVETLTNHQLNLLRSAIRNEFKKISDIAKFIAIDTLSPNLLIQITEYLDSMENNNNLVNKKELSKLPIAGAILLLTSSLYLGAKYVQFASGLRVNANSLTIGTLSATKDYQPLEEYLESKLIPNNFGKFLMGERVKVAIDGDRKLKYQEAKARMIQQEWDIAFTFSPMNSVAAKENGYVYVAKMFPSRPSYYQSVLFTKADNNEINSLIDIKPTTIIAMGEIGSASSFFMPAYDLYGKTLTVKKGNRGQDIVEMVKAGEADIGAAALGDAVKQDEGLKIIQISRNIPGSGVYISPDLSEEDRNFIAKALLEAPQDIQQKANYAAGEEPDYSSFLEIVRRVENVLSCSDLDRNPTAFFCNEPTALESIPDKDINRVKITGKVNGYRLVSQDNVWLNLEGDRQKKYRVIVTLSLLSRIPNVGSPLNLQNRRVEINSVVPRQLPDGTMEVIIKDVNNFNAS